MRPDSTETREQLRKIASPDQFEALVTAVLRAAVPAYASLIHVGTNAAGRAVRSPIDGIDIRVDSGSRHLLLVQHTITARKDLRRKWLDVKNGDVAKARKIFEAEVGGQRVDEATLVLTVTTDPDEALIRDVHAAVAGRLRVDIWSGSRIADFLDRNPEGQWLREQQFGTQATRLSASHARAISNQSVNAYLPLVPRSDTVPRALDVALAEFVKAGGGTGFVIGESGLGKSTALRRLADNWTEQGGIALILSHELIEQASSVEQAIAGGLQQYAPTLNRECGHHALGLGTSELPILLIIEDVNRSTNPRRIIERLVEWSTTPSGEGQALRQWRLLCPVWRGNSGLNDPQLRDRVAQNSLVVERFERSEATEAIRLRARSAGISLTTLQLNELAIALGDDPLLIGLNRDWSSPSARDAIQSYVIACLSEAADGSQLMADLRHALNQLTERLVEARTLFPKWSEIRTWFLGDPDTLTAIRRLVDQARIIYFATGPDDERLMYRHDRVRDHLLTDAMARLIVGQRLGPELWSEPFYAGVIGGALGGIPEAHLTQAAACNPVALFAALQNTSLDESRRARIVAAAQEWVQSPGFSAGDKDEQRHHAMSYLAGTDGPFVPELAKRFPWSYRQLEALVRNGDVRAAAALCGRSDPGMNDAWRDRMITHALSRHATFVSDLAELICQDDLSPKQLEGALSLAGEVADPALCDALAKRWAHDGQLSTGWLWATLRCCQTIKHPLVETLCDVWGKLPTKVKRNENDPNRNPRWDIAGYSLAWAFRRRPQPSAIAFLVARATQDKKLTHVLSTILKQIDSPEAVLYSVTLAAKISRRTEKSGGLNLFATDLKDTWSPDWRGRALSARSRAVLEPVWRNRRTNQIMRRIAFLIWSLTPTRADFEEFAALEADAVLADTALRARLALGDQSAIPLLRNRIWNSENGEYWWYHARKVGLAGLREDVVRYFDERRSDQRTEGKHSGCDYVVSELLMDERDEFAAQTIVANWDQLESSPRFVQAALYLATAETVALARSAIAKSSEPAKLLEFIDMHWGIKNNGRRGVTDFGQLQVLEPYYKLMGDMEICSFFEAANELGALNWRKQHLDPLVAELDRGYCGHGRDSLFASLDDEVTRYLQFNRKAFSIDHWFERREKELRTRGELLAAIGEWASKRASEPAIALLCEALLRFGERPELSLLDSLPSTLHESCADKIANCRYGVRKRSLSPEPVAGAG